MSRSRELSNEQVARICKYTGAEHTLANSMAIREAYRQGLDADCMSVRYKQEVPKQQTVENSNEPK